MIPNPYENARDESPGEAQIRLASWFKALFVLLGVRLYPFEEEALAKVMGALIRKWPALRRWKAPKK
jgi:hypothetical protein